MLFFLKTLLFTAALTCSSLTFSFSPQRFKGISMHMLPKKVARLSGAKWGLIVTYAPYLQPEKKQPILQSAQEVKLFVQKQDIAVQKNGVWIVFTHPNAYSDAEKKIQEAIKILCRNQHIPLFITRAKQLPYGWKRYDK